MVFTNLPQYIDLGDTELKAIVEKRRSVFGGVSEKINIGLIRDCIAADRALQLKSKA